MEVVNLQKIQTTGMIPSVITDFILLSGFFYRPISVGISNPSPQYPQSPKIGVHPENTLRED